MALKFPNDKLTAVNLKNIYLKFVNELNFFPKSFGQSKKAFYLCTVTGKNGTTTHIY